MKTWHGSFTEDHSWRLFWTLPWCRNKRLGFTDFYFYFFNSDISCAYVALRFLSFTVRSYYKRCTNPIQILVWILPTQKAGKEFYQVPVTFIVYWLFSLVWSSVSYDNISFFFFFFPRSKQREWPHSACSWLSHSEIVCVTAAWIDLKIFQPIKCICTLLQRSCSKITGELYNVVIYLKLKWCFKHNGFSTLWLLVEHFK